MNGDAAVTWVNGHFPDTAHVSWRPDMVVVHPSATQAADVAALLATALPAPYRQSFDRMEVDAGECTLKVTFAAPTSVGMRLLATALIDLDAITRGALVDVLSLTVSWPRQLTKAAPTSLLEQDGPRKLIGVWFEEARYARRFASDVTLDDTGEILAALLTDIASAHGYSDRRAHLIDVVVGDVAETVITMAEAGQSITSIARGLAADRPVRVTPHADRTSTCQERS